MRLQKGQKKIRFRGLLIQVQTEFYFCPICNVEAGTVEQTAVIQKAVSDGYKKSVGLLTAQEIVEGRKKQKLSQADLAKRMNVGIASVKRWEGGLIQSKSMDQAIRLALKGKKTQDGLTGNRPFSIPRINLVLKKFEEILGRPILKKGDKMLYAAKYLWYADMAAHRDLGISLTGSTYAALPHGPQLNNYRELIEDIMAADVKKADPLLLEEVRIIKRVAQKFPKDRVIYDAAHQEAIWINKSKGALISYAESEELMLI